MGGGLGVVDVGVGTVVPPRSDVDVDGAGDLAFGFAEDGAVGVDVV